ncbi:TRAP-type C4-dicarboxylate transport system, small permease component [Lentibacillus halodurans]|uniref:TRAP-type C4-dicarboxylate transport system, small permease component n=1 Tax=Lentibacillus halodurans TaxID=237679 RepID=A0A1I0W764_9BACI|nr:TRAP transporter small permease [Lentibacillus halodurans]SFA84542.1 TRAP-type C4-dicarboxylate transport system, small permease component [Lentibacillus halodurans]
MKALKILSGILKILTVLTFSALMIVVLIQIIGRFTPFSFVWTEELTRYLFIYSVAFGAPVAMEKREYITVDLLIGFLPEKVRKYYNAFIYFVLGVFGAMLITHAYDFALLGEGQTSATLEIEMFYVHLSMVITLIFVSLYSFLNIYHMLRDSINESEEGVE